jgi:hypothetical protein
MLAVLPIVTLEGEMIAIAPAPPPPEPSSPV